MNWRELAVLAAVGVGLFFSLASVDAFEQLTDFVKRHEEWELDEVVLVVPVITCLLAIFTVNRLFDLKREKKQRSAMQAEIIRVATTNTLTGLPNENATVGAIADRLNDTANQGGLVMIIRTNLRRRVLKRFDDQSGINALNELVLRLRRALPLKSVVGSLDNDSMILFVPGIKADERGKQLIEALTAACAAPFEQEGFSFSAQSRFGLAYVGPGEKDAQELVRNALRALEQLRAGDVSGLAVYDEELERNRHEKRELFLALKQAIEKDEIDCVFQPIIHLETGATLSFEALARWRPPGGEPVSPEVFIPMLERSGLIEYFTDAILERALRCAKALPQDVGISVNISRVQLLDPQLYMRIFQRLQKHSVTARRLDLEVTETTDISEPTTSRQSIIALRALGVKISIDDFGTGFSNLNVLYQIDFDTIKIDRQFIKEIATSPKNRAIVEATLAMAKSLRRTVTVEGVEDERTATLLRELGVERAQGYLYGKPMSEADAVNFCRTRPGPGMDFRTTKTVGDATRAIGMPALQNPDTGTGRFSAKDPAQPVLPTMTPKRPAPR